LKSVVLVQNQIGADTEELSYPHTQVFTICHAHALIDIFRRRPEDMASLADAVVSLSGEHGLPHWMAFGRILEGWAATISGDAAQGIERLRAGVAAWHRAGARLWLPLFLTLRAEAWAKAGQNDQAIETIVQAIAIAQDSGERWYLAEIIRIKAGLLSETGRPARQVEALLANSLEIARSQQARCWELRTACDLALLWQSSGRVKEARQLLQPIYVQFTEGFGAPDLRYAKQILDSLKPNGSQQPSKSGNEERGDGGSADRDPHARKNNPPGRGAIRQQAQ